MTILLNLVFYIFHFLIETFLLLLIFRLILLKFDAPSFNPIVDNIIKVTEPIVKPFRFIPSYHRIDFAILFLLFIFQAFSYIFLFSLKLNGFPNLIGILLITIGGLGNKFINIYVVLVILAVVISWFPQFRHNPLTPIIIKLTSPLFAITNKLIPPIYGIDFSPFIILIGLKLFSIVIFDPLQRYGLLFL